MTKQTRKGLGRGLSALMADVEPAISSPKSDAPAKSERRIPIDRIAPNPDQPRRSFDQEALDDLARSISERGIIQPIILRPHPKEAAWYEIVAGERRWRAAQMAKLHDVPAIVRDFDDVEVLEVAIIENIQRADLNPVEEARGFRNLIDRFGHTQEKVAEALGKSRSHVANAMRLLTLPEPVIAFLEEGRLSAGHARALITATDPIALAKEVIAKGLSVRETERLARSVKSPDATAKAPPAEKDADTRRLEADLSATLKMKVRIDHGANGAGSLTVNYRDLSELDDLCRLLSQVEMVD